MRYYELREKLKDFVVFSLRDVRFFEPDFHRPRLNEWQDKGYIKKLRRGFYVFSDTVFSEESLFVVANHLYSPSYVSFETALSRYGLIPEGVYSITSASTAKTVSFKSGTANFIYHRINPKLNFGYRLEEQQGRKYKIAEMEKAVLDYLYLHPLISQMEDFHEWRFNSEEFLSRVDFAKLHRYAEAFGSETFLIRLEKLLVLMKEK